MATAIDTNVLVRLIVKDDADQLSRAQALVKSEQCVVLPTVLLETGWVLRSVFGMLDAQIARELRRALDVPTFVTVDPQAIRQALDDAEAGMDLADAFHRAFAGAADRLVTFDRQFASAASPRPGVQVEAV